MSVAEINAMAEINGTGSPTSEATVLEPAPSKSAPGDSPDARDAAGQPAADGRHRPEESYPVRSGETPWTSEELAEIREELTTELSRIEHQVHLLQSSIADVLRDSGDGAGDDSADSGSKAFEREQEMTLLANTQESLFQTRHALRRIADGSYGVCESCGEAVGKLRLQAFPRATLCVSCKQKQERR